MEAKIKADAAVNSKEWFNKASMSAEVLDALWSPMLRYPKGEDGEPDRTRSPSLNVKLPCWDGEFKFELYDLEENAIFPPEDQSGSAEVLKKLITKTQNVALVIECGGIWFANGKFGVTWRLTQGVVKPLVTLKGKCHIKLDGATKKKLQEQKVAVQEEESTTLADDSDDDEVELEQEQEQEVAVEEPAEVEVEATPPPAPKKVVRRKKKA